jgi:outer membrane receptor for ferrienterochelin and colicins
MRSLVMRAAFMLLASMAFVAPLAAQDGAVTGRVVSAESAAPVGGARVEAVSPAGQVVAGTLTDGSGRFRLSPLPSGSYVVVVNMIGFEARRVEDVRVAAGSTTDIEIEMISRAVQLNPIVVSASRRVERALDAPARVEVVGTREIEERPAVTPVDHLRNVPGVDVASSGVQSTNVVVRGFNNVFSGSLYALTDHRIAGVPSLRVNFLHFVPATNEDIERMEVVLGPGAALYGPNTANGVLHMMTRSPLTSTGTTLTLSGGEQSLFQGSFRTAHRIGEDFGIKLSGQYLQADEWQYNDPAEIAEQAKFASDPAFWRQDLMRAYGIDGTEADRRIARIGARDFDITRWSGEARADWRIRPDLSTVLSVGTTTSNGVELTGLGAGQAVDWRYTYYQARATWGRAFGQVYLNTSDAGETFLLRNGAPIVDRSKLLVGQLQHGLSLGERQNFTYGADYLWTMPETEGTINGIYEDEDETREFGAYIQSETALSPMFDLVLAGRVDTHSALPNAIFSPRAALVFKPAENQALRVSFNRAFSTPSSLNQFLDLGSSFPNEAAARLGYSLRVQGTGDRGFALRQPDGSYRMRSPFTPLLGAGDPGTLLPAGAAPFFPVAFGGIAPQVRAGLIAQGVPAAQADAIIGFIAGLRPTGNDIATAYSHPTGGSGLLANLELDRIDPIRESTSNTFEVGYKGILGGRLLLAADVWYSKRENLVTPLTIATPFLLLEGTTTGAYLATQLTGFFMAAGMPQAQAQAQAAAIAPLVAGGVAQVPVGVISSSDINANGAQLLVTYFNVDDDLDLYGTDVSATALLTDQWSLSVNGSLVNKDVFTTRLGELVTLNAPKTKGSVALNYRNDGTGFNAEGRMRYTAGFPVNSGVFIGTACIDPENELAEPCVSAYTLADLTLGYRIPGFRGTSLQLSVQNLLDERYRSFPGVPEIGRMAILRLRQEF